MSVIVLLVLLAAPLTAPGQTRPIAQEGASIVTAEQKSTRDAAARALFQEGLVHADARRWAEAADRFERARALRSTAEITYNLTTALIGLGRLVRASELLREVAGAQDASFAVRSAARSRLAEVTPRLAHLTVQLPPRLWERGASVSWDGERLDQARLGVSLPADPGVHVVEASGGGTDEAAGRSDRRGITLREGERRTVSFADIMDVGRSPEPPATADATPAAGPRLVSTGLTDSMASSTTVATPPATATATASSARRTRWWVWGVVGGAVALGVTAAVVTAAMSGSDEPPAGSVGTWELDPR